MNRSSHGGMAARCRHFHQGRCLYAEDANPGFGEKNICSKLAWMIRQWDDFIDRAESFQLSEQEAFRAWHSLFPKKLSASPPCTARPGRDEGPASHFSNPSLPDCPHLFRNLCLLSLPACNGLCLKSRAGSAADR